MNNKLKIIGNLFTENMVIGDWNKVGFLVTVNPFPNKIINKTIIQTFYIKDEVEIFIKNVMTTLSFVKEENGK